MHDINYNHGVEDAWEADLEQRYPETDYEPDGKAKDAFRNYDDPARDTVREFYRINHERQTLALVKEKKAKFAPGQHGTMGIWEAMEFLDTLVDDSDPDTEMSQIQHLLQTAEGIRKDGHPDWFILTGLIHDLGKVLCLYGEAQWAVVGDTFPVGCAFSDKIVYPEFFAENPDTANPKLTTECGIYARNGGLDQVHISWGHDEYLYQVVKAHLPEEALYMIRYHSFYAAHREKAYDYLMNDHDRAMFRWVKAFNPYDLYTKSDAPPDVSARRPYYEGLIQRFFPETIAW
ncbi:MAG: inositol oxygenase [Candidatus Hydrogenedentes bacterium]|nr:inositol oxygenase [Candidatus Hydrogenedentota bacterium]